MFTPGGQFDHINLVVFGGGKGGGGGGGQQYTPPANTVLSDPVSGKTFVQVNDPMSPRYNPNMSAQDQLNAEIAEREAGEQAKTAQGVADKQAADANKMSSFQTNRQKAYDTALNDAMRKFQLQGVDPTKYLESDIKPALTRQFNSVQDLDPNPTAAFTPDTGDNLISNILSGKRTQAANSLNSIFSPTYAETALPDSLTDQYRDTLLNEQFDPLEAQLGNAQKRGMLSPTGYGGAESALKQKRSAASATIGDLGSGILAADRGGVNDYISKARSDVNNLSLAGDFDPSVYSSGAQGKIGAAQSNFGGALRNAVGETKFADISELLNAGGAVQGALNSSDPAGAGGGGSLSPSFVSEEELASKKRGLGNTGAF